MASRPALKKVSDNDIVFRQYYANRQEKFWSNLAHKHHHRGAKTRRHAGIVALSKPRQIHVQVARSANAQATPQEQWKSNLSESSSGLSDREARKLKAEPARGAKFSAERECPGNAGLAIKLVQLQWTLCIIGSHVFEPCPPF